MTEPMNPELLRVVESDMARWVRDRIEVLPGRAKFCAHNAVRSLYWAGGIATLESTTYREGERGYRVPATFFLMHALEEAVAAFIACAKKSGYTALAKKVSPKDHVHKSTLPWLCGQIIELLGAYKIGLAYQADHDRIAVRYEDNGQVSYQVASMRLLGSVDQNGNSSASFADDIYARFTNEKDVHRLLKEGSGGRNYLIYADDNGFRTGPLDLEPELREIAVTVIGILWATVDMWEHKGERIQLVEIILKTTHELAEAAK
ncbi:hypothetical protein [Paracoccus sp. SCSIO 75233]|uniref:hypothetical protein n=1 Tax=Paracoccus sp. SCSIO 75233 TaxID=3017782 RepID=UPI0022F0F9DC|nr:hypothetical protein [Paracoccus sp. SCSIO 75233]WBU55377.1 hypothetical protein PAF12_18705 [Paracoccus sp. SCSIO 75233]